MTTNQEHINRLTEAQDLLREALGILKDVASETDSPQAEAYIIPGLATLIDHESEWLNRYDHTVQDWIDGLSENEADTEDEDIDAVLDEQDEAAKVAPSHYMYPAPIDPATFPHTPEFAKTLMAAYGESRRKIPAIQMYRQEYGVGLKEAKDAVEYIFNQTDDTEEITPVSNDTGVMVDQPSFPHDAAYAQDTRAGIWIFPDTTPATRVGMYANRWNVSQELARAAVNYILSQES